MLFGVVVVTSLWMLFSPGDATPSVGIDDKVVHATLFAVLALTGALARFKPAPLGLGLVAYACLSEVLPAVLPIRRDGDWHDAAADLVGIAVGLVGAAVLLRRVAA